MIQHDEAEELLGAYALDALDDAERVEVDDHLDACPRCRAELDSLREVAGALGNSVEPLPEGLWSQIASRLPPRPGDEGTPPMPPLVRGGAKEDDASPFRTAHSGRERRRRVAVVTLATAAVGAAAVAIVLGIGLVRANDHVSDLQAQVARPPTAAARALDTPGHRLVDLRSASGAPVAGFVVLPDGRGYLVSSSLPALGRGRTYQLWGIARSRTVSLGLLGNAPRQATFTMAGGNGPSRLAVTAEPAGGTVAPTTPVVATGAV